MSVVANQRICWEKYEGLIDWVAMRVLREGYLYPYLPPYGVASAQVLQQISTGLALRETRSDNPSCALTGF